MVRELEDVPGQRSAAARRYRFLRALGEGGMGAVELVHDEVRGEDVARKRVLRANAASLIRLKREFRAIEHLRHPNIVELHDLDEDDTGPFFTMEVIRGVGVLEHCSAWPSEARVAPSALTTIDALGPTDAAFPLAGREAASGLLAPAPGIVESTRIPLHGMACDVARLERVLPQMLDALAFLHVNGIVHRDVKPGNVMVRDDGVVKLLDFGILAELSDRGAHLDRGVALGTPAFMAPEQLRGQPPTPATDVYALGAMLFCLVTGRELFSGTVADLAGQILSTTPPRLSSIVWGVPGELDRICAAMLAKAPEDRPSIEAIAHELAPGRTRTIPAPAEPSYVVGREALSARLDREIAAPDRRFVAMVVEGATGVGKTTLVEELGRRARARGALVLTSRARHNDAVTFNAVDGAIDALALALPGLALPPEAHHDLALASRAFPVLLDPGDAALRAREPGRGEIFAAVAGLLRAAAARADLVLFLDDLQWADADSLMLLDAIATEAPAGVAIVATLRDDVGATRASAWVSSVDHVVRVTVPPLDEAATVEVVRRAAWRLGLALDEDDVARAARASAGRPFMAEVLGRALGSDVAGGGGPEAALRRVVEDLPAPERAALVVLAAEDGWLPIAELAMLGDVSRGVIESRIRDLERRGLARRSGGTSRDARVAIYHDAVGVAVRGLASSAELRVTHAHIANRLEATPNTAPHRLVRHLLACDAKERAVPHAREAARRALDKRAYSLAADMLRVVVTHGPPPDAALLRTCGDALQRSGRYAEAAADWRALATITAGDAHVEARLLEAQARLSAGEVFEGRACLDAALRDAGEPTTSIGAIGRATAILRFMTGPRPRWARVEPPAGHSVTPSSGFGRAELDVKLANVVGYYEPIAGMRLQARVRDRCDRNGQREYAAWCDFTFAYFALFLQARNGPSRLADRYRAAAEERLDGRPAEHHAVRAFPFLLDAVLAQREGRWMDGAAAADRALAVIEEGGLQGTLEHLFVLVHRFQMDLFAQTELPIEASVARMRRASGDSADTALRCHLLSAEVYQRALFGDVDGASRAARRLLESLPRDIWTFQRIAMSVTAALPDVLTTDCREARRRVRDVLVAGRSLRPLENMYLAGFGGIAAMIEACALRAGAEDADVAFIREIARRSRVGCPFGHTVGARALAYVEDELGRPEEAIRVLASAEIDALAFGQRVDAAVARYQRGLRLGGDEGRALCASARALAAETGARAVVLDEDPKHR